MENKPDNGVVNRAVEPLSYLPDPNIGEWFLQEIRSREKFILEMGGEPVKLLKRKNDGAVCTTCWDVVRKQARSDCTICYGTGIIGGYYDVLSILVSFVNPSSNKVVIQEHGQKREVVQRNWTLWEPQLQNKDILVNKHNQRYWIEQVTPSKWRGHVLHQNFDTSLIEISNILYQVPVGDFKWRE